MWAAILKALATIGKGGKAAAVAGKAAGTAAKAGKVAQVAAKGVQTVEAVAKGAKTASAVTQGAEMAGNVSKGFKSLGTASKTASPVVANSTSAANASAMSSVGSGGGMESPMAEMAKVSASPASMASKATGAPEGLVKALDPVAEMMDTPAPAAAETPGFGQNLKDIFLDAASNYLEENVTGGITENLRTLGDYFKTAKMDGPGNFLQKAGDKIESVTNFGRDAKSTGRSKYRLPQGDPAQVAANEEDARNNQMIHDMSLAQLMDSQRGAYA